LKLDKEHLDEQVARYHTLSDEKTVAFVKEKARLTAQQKVRGDGCVHRVVCFWVPRLALPLSPTVLPVGGWCTQLWECPPRLLSIWRVDDCSLTSPPASISGVFSQSVRTRLEELRHELKRLEAEDDDLSKTIAVQDERIQQAESGLSAEKKKVDAETKQVCGRTCTPSCPPSYLDICPLDQRHVITPADHAPLACTRHRVCSRAIHPFWCAFQIEKSHTALNTAQEELDVAAARLDENTAGLRNQCAELANALEAARDEMVAAIKSKTAVVARSATLAKFVDGHTILFDPFTIVESEGDSEGKVVGLRKRAAESASAVQTLTSDVLGMQSKASALRKELEEHETRVPELERAKKLAVSGRNFKDAARIAAEIKVLAAAREEQGTQLGELNATLLTQTEEVSVSSFVVWFSSSVTRRPPPPPPIPRAPHISMHHPHLPMHTPHLPHPPKTAYPGLTCTPSSVPPQLEEAKKEHDTVQSELEFSEKDFDVATFDSLKAKSAELRAELEAYAARSAEVTDLLKADATTCELVLEELSIKHGFEWSQPEVSLDALIARTIARFDDNGNELLLIMDSPSPNAAVEAPALSDDLIGLSTFLGDGAVTTDDVCGEADDVDSASGDGAVTADETHDEVDVDAAPEEGGAPSGGSNGGEGDADADADADAVAEESAGEVEPAAEEAPESEPEPPTVDYAPTVEDALERCEKLDATAEELAGTATELKATLETAMANEEFEECETLQDQINAVEAMVETLQDLSANLTEKANLLAGAAEELGSEEECAGLAEDIASLCSECDAQGETA
jgi:hypothetical protein